jgi:hypothetical protein
MNELYPAVYRDSLGAEIATIQNDGKRLTIIVRGVTFFGSDFDLLEAALPRDDPQLGSFTLHHGHLCNCEIEWQMPVPLVSPAGTSPGRLHAHLKLGLPRPLPSSGIESEDLQLHLDFEGQTYSSCGRHGYFEDELREIQNALPEGVYLQCCFNCAFSDYSPAGSGLFGDMLCFRDNKQAYLTVQDKYDLFRIWDTMTEMVQETYLCPEFERRVSGAGYRG